MLKYQPSEITRSKFHYLLSLYNDDQLNLYLNERYDAPLYCSNDIEKDPWAIFCWSIKFNDYEYFEKHKDEFESKKSEYEQLIYDLRVFPRYEVNGGKYCSLEGMLH